MQALRLAARSLPGALVPCNLSSDLAAALIEAKTQGAPVAFVIRERDLPAVESLAGLVVRRDDQPDPKGLKDVLLGFPSIPLIRGKYVKPGKLLYGVQMLLEAAVLNKDHNAYVIAATESLFEMIWRQASGADDVRQAPPLVADAPPSQRSPQVCNLKYHLTEMLPVPDVVMTTYVGVSRDVQLVRQLIVRAATSGLPVLILGETGTGKELIAQLIHLLSGRRGPFVSVNCALIAGDLLASELFGCVKGAFTNATKRAGRWVKANGGTLLLDELGDMVLRHQAAILRAISPGVIQAVGSDKDVRVDVRLISATNPNRRNRLRPDLYYRLGAFVIETPRLADHRDDIRPQANHFWQKITKLPDIELPADVLAKLATYHWGGNSRELENFLGGIYTTYQRADGLTPDQIVLPGDCDGRQEMDVERHGDVVNLESHFARCIAHLIRVDKTLRACKVAVRPVVVGRKQQPSPETIFTVRSALVQHLARLELLCDHMLLFRTWPAFELVRHTKGQLTTFVDYLDTDPSLALHLWDTELLEDYTRAAKALFYAMLRVEKAVLAYRARATAITRDRPGTKAPSASHPSRPRRRPPPADPTQESQLR